MNLQRQVNDQKPNALNYIYNSPDNCKWEIGKTKYIVFNNLEKYYRIAEQENQQEEATISFYM